MNEPPAQSKPTAPIPTAPPKTQTRWLRLLGAVLLSDPLGSAARGERRNLLAGSLTALLVTHVGLVPEKIESLGIRLDTADLRRLVLVFFWVMMYFLVMFVGYAVADVLARMRDYLERMEDTILGHSRYYATHQQESRRQENEGRNVRTFSIPAPSVGAARQEVENQFPGASRLPDSSRPAALIRGFLDFVLPVAIGIWALWTLATFKPTSSVPPKPPAPRAAAPPAQDRTKPKPK